jgi:hypothetical protein
MGPSASVNGTAPPTNPEEPAPAAPSAPTSSASKTTLKLPVLMSILLAFSVAGSNKRVLFMCVLLASVGYSYAGGPPSPRETLGLVLGQFLYDYFNTIGKCTSHMSEVRVN